MNFASLIAECAILDVVVRFDTPSVRPDDNLMVGDLFALDRDALTRVSTAAGAQESQ